MVYLRIREDSLQAKALLAFLKTEPFVEFIAKTDVPNSKTLKAISESEKSEGKRHKNVASLMNDLKS